MNKSNLRKKNLIYLLIYAFLFLLIILSIIYIIDFFSVKKKAKIESNLLNTIEIDEVNQINEDEINKIDEIKVTKQKTERMLQVEALQKENTEIVGWLEIKDTAINYPVLQGQDNEYYMTHNYKKEKSRSGSIFLSKDYDWNIPSSNLLIYGHNLQNGTMFEELLKYNDVNFYNKHPVINFTTSNDDSEYEIISVFKSKVYYKTDQNVFRYYFFINAQTEDEYNNYVSNAKKASLYNIEPTAKYGDQLITLSTCSYHVKDGRFVVVGRKKES